MTRFEDPWVLLFLLLIPAAAWRHFAHSRGRGSLLHANLEGVKNAIQGQSQWLKHIPFVLRATAFSLLIIAAARPQAGVSGESIVSEGIDIILLLDISSSMLAEDLEPNRIEAAKAVAVDFTLGRDTDRIGLVVFAGKAFTQAPLTLDYSVLTGLIRQLEVGIIEDGTAIGMGLATAVKRLEASSAASKVVVLLTDGRNNRGEIDPLTAVQAAQALGVRIYAIGVGQRSGSPRIPMTDPLGRTRYVQASVEVDEETLSAAADATGGKYFRATDRGGLIAIYDEIDELEKTEVEIEHFTTYGERFALPLLAGLFLLVSEIVVSAVWLRTLP